MGIFEERLWDIIGKLAEGDLLKEMVEEAMEAHSGIFALMLAKRILSCQTSASKAAEERKMEQFQYHQGRIAAFREAFTMIAFDGLEVDEKDVQAALEFWVTKG